MLKRDMIAKAVYIGTPSRLRVEDEQLIVLVGDDERRIPLEDIATLEIDSPQVMITSPLMSRLAERNVAVIHCGPNHMPISMSLPISRHSSHTERLRVQLTASVPRCKTVWRRIVQAKIMNQADVLRAIGVSDAGVRNIIKSVRSGDSTNREGFAAKRYWTLLFSNHPELAGRFTRDPEGAYPNALFNYGYSIVRALVSRALVSTGLHPSIGLFHRNKYNAFCLADDIMEPFRPFVDLEVYNYLLRCDRTEGRLTPVVKKYLLAIPFVDARIGTTTQPLMTAIQRTCSSLWESFADSRQQIVLPLLPADCSRKESTCSTPEFSCSRQ